MVVFRTVWPLHLEVNFFFSLPALCRYNPQLKGNIYEKRAASISEQLLGPDMVVDYDQLLSKPPNKPDAEFKW